MLIEHNPNPGGTVPTRTKKTPHITEVWFTTKRNASTPEARASITAALELHLVGFGQAPKRRWHGRTNHGMKLKRTERGRSSELCVRFLKLEPHLRSEATQAALTAIRTVFPDASVDVRVTVRQVIKMYGYDRHEARFIAAIMNGDSDGDCIVIGPDGKLIRESVLEFEA
jgi:hypothetical protein